MASSSTEKQWRITVTVETALCIGDSGTGEINADKSTLKTSDGKLYIPASTLKGIWRHACEAIVRSQGHFVCNSPRAENMCPRPQEEQENKTVDSIPDDHCIICQIFGSPKSEARILISDLTLDNGLETVSTEIRSGVTIDRNLQVAADQRLYFTETSIPNAGFEFSGNVTIGNAVTDYQVELLSAGINYIHAIGSGKTHGLGWLKIKREQTALDHPTQEFKPVETDSNGFTELSIEVRLKSPLITGGRKQAGGVIETVPYIRGGLIRGAVAKAWLATSENSEPDESFKKLFINDRTGIFRNCTPGSKVLPATAVGCKDFSGFRKTDEDDKHGIFDTLLKRIVLENSAWLYQPNCPICSGRVETQGGFYEKVADAYEKRSISTRLLTRVAINRQRKVAEDELLYHLGTIDPISAESNEVTFRGSARVPSDLVDRVANTLQQKVNRLGGGGSRGLGEVSLKLKKDNGSDSLVERIDNFNNELQSIWKRYVNLPSIGIDQFEGTYFTVDLQSETILTTKDGWQRSMVLTASMLQDMAECPADVRLVRSFASYDYVGGWNAAWGLPKQIDLVTRMGSVFVFQTPDIDSWIPYLQVLENIGIGARCEEGFGQLLVCDPFHLHIGNV